MKLSLRGRLGLLWALIVVTCISLGVIMWGMYRQGAGYQIDASQGRVRDACTAIQESYARYVPHDDASGVKPDLLYVVLQLTLRDISAVEGGIWKTGDGFIAYAYPTYEGTGVKRDVPDAEKPRLAVLAEQSVKAQSPQLTLQRGQREALVAAACPLPGTTDAAAWTLTRVPSAVADVYDRLTLGIGLLLLFVLASGTWVAVLTSRWARRLSGFEAALAGREVDELAPLSPTGEPELDRIVGALNRFSRRLVVATDESKALGRRLAQADRLAALGRMTAGIAHEIRNPIAAMRLKAENAIAQPGPRQAAALTTILAQIERLDKLVQSMLAMTQPIALDVHAVDVGAWIGEHLNALHEASKAAGVTLADHADVDRWWFDPLHVGRALDNLLWNALQSTPRGGRVEVSAAREGTSLVIRVNDSGSGVAEQDREQIFEPFATRRTHVEGTGLGLALTREIMLAHGGNVRLHLRRRTRARRLNWSYRGANPDHRRRRGFSGGLAETIETWAMTRLLAGAEEGFGELSRGRFDAMFIDFRMPGMSGLEVLAALKDRIARPPPAIMLTAYASGTNTIEAMRLGAFDHLTKPIGRERCTGASSIAHCGARSH